MKWLPIHAYATELGEPFAMRYPFGMPSQDVILFHSWRDMRRSQRGARGPYYRKLPKRSDLIPYSDNPSEFDMRILEEFVVLMYDRTCPVFTVNEGRKYLFTKLNRPIENCPPTLDSLIQHTKRAMLQSLIWMECLFNAASVIDIWSC